MKARQLLAALLALVCLTGCFGKGNGEIEEDPALVTETEATEAPTEAPSDLTAAPTDRPSISWKTAFRWPNAPTGYLTEDSVAFYRLDDEQEPWVEVLTKEALERYMEDADPIPRTTHFDDELLEDIEGVMPALTYAFNHACPKLCFPSRDLTEEDILAAPVEIHINGQSLSAITVQTLPMDDGKNLRFIQVSFNVLMRKNAVPRFREALQEAWRLVRELPEDYTDYQKAMHLYSYLADNVRYFSGDEATDYYTGEWDYLYDALIQKECVCSGYTEALYYLFNMAGLDCFEVSGDVRGNVQVNGHVWNVAKLDGKYYQFDVTWDEGMPPELFRFFAVSWEDMNSYYPRYLHARCADYCPDCDSSLLPPISNFESGYIYEAYGCLCYYNLLLREPDEFYEFFREGGKKAAVTGTAEDGWEITNLDYDKAIGQLPDFPEQELLEFCLNRVYRKEADGKLSWNPDGGMIRVLDLQARGKTLDISACYIDRFGVEGEHFEVSTKLY